MNDHYCPICRKPVDIDDPGTLYRILYPSGFSLDAVKHALLDAEAAEKATPSTGRERNGYLFLGASLGVGIEADRIIVGRTLKSLGCRLARHHFECVDLAPLSNAYGDVSVA